MKKKLNVLCVALALTAASTVANATPTLVDQFKVNSDFASFGQYSAADGSSVSATIYTEGTGSNQVIYLRSFVFGGPTGGAIYDGPIPSSAVTWNGTDSVSVNFDTCTAGYYTAGTCGLVNVTVTKDAGVKPVILNGVSHQTWGDVLYQTAGIMTFRQATVTGVVHGVVLTTDSQAWMGTDNNVTVTITKGN